MQAIRELYLYPLTGLYDECHNIDYATLSSISNLVPDGKHCLRQINNLWWHHAFSRETLQTMVDRLQNRYRYTPIDVPQHRAILANPSIFIEAAQEASKTIANLGAGAREAFSALETLQIFCNLYSDMISSPYVLSLQEGLVLNELSALVLVREALNPSSNPYLDFIKHYYLPILRAAQPDLLWIVGPIKMSTIAMAMLAREDYPNCHISVMGHSTEYYSLNKITKYLKQNTMLFSVIDSIVLDDFENTVPQLAECLAAGQPLETVPNLLYAKKTENVKVEVTSPIVDTGSTKQGRKAFTIEATPMLVSRKSFEYNTHHHPVSVGIEERLSHQVDPSEVVDVKLWPNAKCYWDKCNFCAINRKYQTLPMNAFRDAEQVADYMISLSEQGVRYFWSNDEAIPPKTLGELAQFLIAKGAQFTWETRSKIDRGFSKEICTLLGQAGLREIRLGLESASTRVLSAMGKFPDGWSLDLIERVVSYFHNAGVSVHFPTIIGFPTETDAERMETFAFLQYIVGKYPSVTFNMNILGFDIASKLYENYEDLGITSIHWPAPAKYFLGNLLDWDCAEVPFEYERLDQQRNELMRKLLYPWMPATATIPTYIYYRLSETSRATMIWKSQRYAAGNWKDVLVDFSDDTPLVVSPRLTVSGPLDRGAYSSGVRFQVYDWKTHHSMECDEQGYELIEVMRVPRTFHQIMEYMQQRSADELSLQDIYDKFGPQVHKLYRMGIVFRADVPLVEKAQSLVLTV